MNPFEIHADDYDRWFDSPNGRSIFLAELSCLRELIPGDKGRWLEIGMGTGRFAEALGIEEGIDPSKAVLDLAAMRGIRVCRACGEALPYRDCTFDGLLIVTTICFVSDPRQTLRECFRVSKNGGCLIVGFVPADSPWGKMYVRRGKEGHRFYSGAKFYTREELVHSATEAGFVLEELRSCLLCPPGEPNPDFSRQEGFAGGAGFVALKFTKCADNSLRCS